MAKKKTTKKKTTKKAATRRSGSTTSRSKKTTSKKTAARKKTTTKKTTKKSASKKTTKKTTKKTAKKAASKKTTKKAPARKTTTKKTAKKAPARKAASKKTTTKKTTKKTVVKKTTKTTAAASKKKTTVKKVGRKSSAASTKSEGGSSRRRSRSVAEAAAAAQADAQGYVIINGRRVRMVSTKGLTPSVKKTRRSTTEATESTPVPAKPKTIKTHLPKKELDHFRNLLLIKRAELAGDISSLEAEALQSGSGDLSHMPIHMADIGTDTYDQDFMLNLAENERQRIREIDEALLRIQEKTYGVCLMTGKPIPKSRLNAKPWAKYTIEAARMLEKGLAAG